MEGGEGEGEGGTRRGRDPGPGSPRFIRDRRMRHIPAEIHTVVPPVPVRASGACILRDIRGGRRVEGGPNLRDRPSPGAWVEGGCKTRNHPWGGARQ